MAFIFLQLLVLGVIAAAADDVHITWSAPPRASLSCEAQQLLHRPPPPLQPDEGSSKPRPKLPVFWRKGNDDLSSKRVSGNGTLEVSRKHNGSDVYQCAIKHQGGLVLGFPVHLNFSYIDKKISINNQTEMTRPRQPVVLTCQVNSGPPAVVSWMKDDELLEDSDRFMTIGSQLLVKDTTTDADGTYSCIAENTVLHKNRTAYLKLTTEEEIDGYIEPSLLPVHHEEDIIASVGSKVVLPCPVAGRPKPSVSWQISRGERTSLLDSTSEFYVIESVQARDEGIYTCTVNRSNLKKTFKLTVSEPVAIKLPPVSKEGIRALTVRFNCTATGNPTPKVTWYKDGKPLVLGGRYNLRRSSTREELVVGAVTSDDAGIYQCFADNNVTMATAWAMLRVTGESPAIPKAVGCWPTGPDKVLFKWGLPGRYTAIAYTVQTSIAGNLPSADVQKSNPEETGHQPHQNTEEEITVPKALYPYIFQVRAYIQAANQKAIEASDFSKGIVCQGQGAPVQFDATNDSVTVSWKEFADQTPGIVSWLLQTRRNSSSERNYTLGANVTSYTLPGPSSNLLVRVMGSRSEQWLPQNWTLVPWNAVTASGKEAGIPEDLKVSRVGAREFTLSWRCDAAACRQGYAVCYEPYAKFEDRDEKCLSTNTESVTISNLRPETDYEVRVRVNAMASQAEKQFSVPVQVTTQPLEVKEAYTHVQYEYTADSVKVFWNGSGAHIVRYSQNITQPVEQWTSEIVTENYIELTKLQPSLRTYVMVMVPGFGEKNQPVLTIPPRALTKHTSFYLVRKRGYVIPDGKPVMIPGFKKNQLTKSPRTASRHISFYLGFGITAGMAILCALVLAAVCIFRKKKLFGSSNRPRRRNISTNEGDEEEASEMKSVGGGLVNGGGSKDAGEPLLNGHVHITENPQSKAPNGKMRKGRLFLDAFDVSRNEDPDTTMETIIDADTSASTTYNLLDTSRRPEYDLSRSSRDLSANNSFNKLPDDNMNSELTRSADFELDNSKIQPTLQPNG